MSFILPEIPRILPQGIIGVAPPGAAGADLGPAMERIVAVVGILPDTSCKLGLLGYLIFLGIGVFHPAGEAAPVFRKLSQPPGKIVEILGFTAGGDAPSGASFFSVGYLPKKGTEMLYTSKHRLLGTKGRSLG